MCLVQLFRNGSIAVSFDPPSEDILNYRCCVGIRFQFVVIVRALQITVRRIRAGVFAVPPLHFKLAANFHGYIPAIVVIHEILERDAQLTAFIECDRINSIIDGNKPDPPNRK